MLFASGLKSFKLYDGILELELPLLVLLLLEPPERFDFFIKGDISPVSIIKKLK
jgi:hypothetical protein